MSDVLDVSSLIQGEFRNALTRNQSELSRPTEVDGVMVLSAAPDLSAEGREEREKTPENWARIKLGWSTLRKLRAEYDRDPLFILNGETEQLLPLWEIAEDFGAGQIEVTLINCGRRGVGNTKTQFEEFSAAALRYNWVLPLPPERLYHLAIITSDYHVPRVTRTASLQLPSTHFSYEVLGVHRDEKLGFGYDVTNQVIGEVKRILHYAKKGDIAWQPRPADG